MGLDNGIIMKKVNQKLLKDIPKELKYTVYHNTDGTNDIELCYWRKCWNIRDAFSNAADVWGECVDFEIDADMALVLAETLQPFLKEDYYNEYEPESIWTYEEALDNNMSAYANLLWLHQYLQKHPEIKVEFYDSW